MWKVLAVCVNGILMLFRLVEFFRNHTSKHSACFLTVCCPLCWVLHWFKVLNTLRRHWIGSSRFVYIWDLEKDTWAEVSCVDVLILSYLKLCGEITLKSKYVCIRPIFVFPPFHKNSPSLRSVIIQPQLDNPFSFLSSKRKERLELLTENKHICLQSVAYA